MDADGLPPPPAPSLSKGTYGNLLQKHAGTRVHENPLESLVALEHGSDFRWLVPSHECYGDDLPTVPLRSPIE